MFVTLNGLTIHLLSPCSHYLPLFSYTMKINGWCFLELFVVSERYFCELGCYGLQEAHPGMYVDVSQPMFWMGSLYQGLAGLQRDPAEMAVRFSTVTMAGF